MQHDMEISQASILLMFSLTTHVSPFTFHFSPLIFLLRLWINVSSASYL